MECFERKWDAIRERWGRNGSLQWYMKSLSSRLNEPWESCSTQKRSREAHSRGSEECEKRRDILERNSHDRYKHRRSLLSSPSTMLRSLLTICVTSFLLGFVFTHWIADSLTLWKSPVTDEHLWTAAAYYSILANGPIIFLYFQSAVIALGLATFFSSIFDGQAVNLMFDGGSIFLFMGSILLYVYSVLPVVFSKFASLPSHQLKDPFPWTLRADTIDLAANNLYCSVALTGVLVLQAGRFWTESAEAEDFDLINDTDLVRFSRAKSPELSS